MDLIATRIVCLTWISYLKLVNMACQDMHESVHYFESAASSCVTLLTMAPRYNASALQYRSTASDFHSSACKGSLQWEDLVALLARKLSASLGSRHAWRTAGYSGSASAVPLWM